MPEDTYFGDPNFPAGSEGIGLKLRWIRLTLGLTQKEFADTLGIGRERWSTYEDQRAPLRWETYRKIGERYGLNPRWLAIGDAHMFAPFDPAILELPIPSRTVFFTAFQEHLMDKIPAGNKGAVIPSEVLREWCEQTALALARFAGQPAEAREKTEATNWFPPAMLKLYAQARFALDGFDWDGFNSRKEAAEEGIHPRADGFNDESENQSLTKHPRKDIFETMPATIPDLGAILSQVREKTSEPGSRKALADKIGVTPARLSEWLSERPTAQKPGAEFTLQLLRFVRGEKLK